MGVKKKHEHESGFFEDHMLNESAKTSRNPQKDWSNYKNSSARNHGTQHQHQHQPHQQQQQMNGGESNYVGKSLDQIVSDYARGVPSVDNHNNFSGYSGSKHTSNDTVRTSSRRGKDDHSSHYHTTHERENHKGKHSSNSNSRGRGHRNQHGDSAQQQAPPDQEVYLISDEEEGVDPKSNAHKQNANDGKWT